MPAPTSGSRRSTRPTRSSPIRSAARRTTCSGRAGRRRPGLRQPAASPGSATSSTRSSAGPQAGARDAATRPPAPTSATTSGSRSRRRSRGPRRRSSSPVLGRCETCSGSGAAPGTEPVTCEQCGGRGEIRTTRRTMLGQMVNVSTCPRCKGEGKLIDDPCPTCKGDGRTERKRTLKVTIPPGIDEGHQIRLSNEGEVGPRGGPPGQPLRRGPRHAPPDAQARGHGAHLRRRRLDRPGRARHDDQRSRRSKARRRSRSRPAPSPGPRSGCAAAACRTSAGRVRAATSTCS